MEPELIIQQLHSSTRRVSDSGVWHDEQFRLAETAIKAVSALRQRIQYLEQQVSNGNADN